MAADSTPAITLVPHTHWDREWYQPFEQFRDRLVEMMDGLIETLDRDPRFAHFHLDGQMAMVDDYLDVQPEREPDIRRLAAEGRISLGPWYTQMDEFLVSGESLIRNLEAGLARASELGPPLMVGYLPDQFGHVGQMPQILGNAGIDRAVVWRGVPSAVDRTSFRWEAPDGSSVVAEYLAFGYGLGWHVNYAEDAGNLTAQLENAVQLLRPLSGRDDRVLVMVGGDHQLAQARLPPMLREVERGGGPAAALGSLSSYLAEDDPSTSRPEWRGELRSAARAHLLPNVYSSRVHQKRERARVESLIERYAEPLAALVPGFEWPSEEVARAWKLLLWNGAHDSVCGCSVDQVADDVDARYAEARALAQNIVDEALSTLAARISEAGTLRFNPSPFVRDGLLGLGWTVDPATAPGGEPIELRREGGAVVADGVRIGLLDEMDVGDLYNFCPDPYEKPRSPDRVEVRPGGFEAMFDGMTVEATVRRRGAAIDMEGVIANERPDHRLRLHVGLPDRADGSTAVTPFELVHRSKASEGSDLEWPSPTWPARGAAYAGGLALLHEGVFEYEVVDGRELAVTLLRCVGTISRQAIASRPWTAGPDIPTPKAQMIGRTAFRIAIVPGASVDDLLAEWERFALSILEVHAPGGGYLPPTGSLLDLEPGGAILSSIRQVEGCTKVRLWNPSDSMIEARVQGRAVALGPARIEMVVLDSDP